MSRTNKGDDQKSRQGRTAPLVALGIVLVVGGVAVLGWYGWQLYGTNWTSKRLQQDIVAELEQTWQATPDPQSVDRRTVVPGLGDALGIVRIPRFGDDYAIPLMETTSLEVLRAGFGHFEGSAEPGGRGNFAIAAHRRTRNEPLRHMPDLRPGDTVVIETAAATFTYEMTTPGDALRVTFRDTWVVDRKPVNPDPDCDLSDNSCVQPPHDSDRLITLTTCADLFHSDYRLAAFGRLVSTEPRRS